MQDWYWVVRDLNKFELKQAEKWGPRTERENENVLKHGP